MLKKVLNGSMSMIGNTATNIYNIHVNKIR